MTPDATPSYFNRVAQDFERVMVPAVFTPWALDLLESAAVRPGERVLDVACGTGIVARLAAPRAGPRGRVVGLDISEGMLAVAREQSAPAGAPIEWQLGSASALPFPDAAFDVVLCQQGLQFVPDRLAALREMHRVLVPGGRVVLSVFSRSAGYEVLEQTAARFVGADAAGVLKRPFALGSAEELRALLAGVQFRTADVHTRVLTVRFTTIDEFIAYQLAGLLAPAVGQLSDDLHAALFADARAAFKPYGGHKGAGFPMEAHVVIARR